MRVGERSWCRQGVGGAEGEKNEGKHGVSVD